MNWLVKKEGESVKFLFKPMYINHGDVHIRYAK